MGINPETLEIIKWICDNCGDITEEANSHMTRMDGDEEIPMPWDGGWGCWKCGKGTRRPMYGKGSRRPKERKR